MTKGELRQNVEQDYSEFFERCFPKTFMEYSRIEVIDEETSINQFDNYIAKIFPFFRYLIDNYYKKNKTPRLQFKNIAKKSRIKHMDNLLFQYLDTEKKKFYNAAEDLFVYILEEFIVNSTDEDFKKVQQPVNKNKLSLKTNKTIEVKKSYKDFDKSGMRYTQQLRFIKETKNKLIWEGKTEEGVVISLYISNWRVPSPTPISVVMTIVIDADGNITKDKNIDRKTQDKKYLETPVITRLKYLREHTKTVRYDPIGPRESWQIGSIYIPKHFFKNKIPQFVDIEVYWQ